MQHHQSRRHVTVPADYVTAAVELGYATTIHAAQGISADVTHGIATPEQSRQQLYTMLTRGRHANHLWLQTTGDGDPALLTQPDATTPPTPTDLLEQILTRDDAARSATTQHADHHHPARLLADAVAAYADGITTAAEHLLGPHAIATIEDHAETLEPGITDEPAWPALRNHLILIASNGTNPLTALTAAHAQHGLDDARDKAATLAWRLDLRHPLTAGPLPWLPGIPTRIHNDPAWATWARQRATLVATLADQVTHQPLPDATWAALPCTDETRRQLATWRAANNVPDTDPRPTGPRQTTRQAAQYQRALDHAIDQNDPALERWKPILEAIGERLTHDPALSRLAHRLDHLRATGHDVHGILADTITAKPLPDDHPAAALLWRLARTAASEPTQNAAPTGEQAAVELPGPDDAATRLALLGMIRDATGPTPPSDAMLRHQLDRADALADSPVPAERLHQVNQLAQDYYASCFPQSWAQPYLVERVSVDLTGHPTIQPGHAPAGWTNLANHLRRHGVTDLEMLTAGLVKPASTGRLIDRFRDRLTLPITDQDGHILGFVARANPTLPADQTGPKYLNTPTTPIYSKGDQFYGHPRPGSIPVIVEGPLDAIAITLGTAGCYTGLAPLGTSLTDHQAALLADQERVVLATDNDAAGNTAADKGHFKLAVHRTNSLRADLPDGSDPAELLITHGPEALTRCLDDATSITDRIVSSASDDAAIDRALTAIAAAHPGTWQQSLERLSQQTRTSEGQLQARLVTHVARWNDDRREAAADTTTRQNGHIERPVIRQGRKHVDVVPEGRTASPRR